jgi:hypothetical protein
MEKRNRGGPSRLSRQPVAEAFNLIINQSIHGVQQERANAILAGLPRMEEEVIQHR